MSQCTIAENLAIAQREVEDKFLASSERNDPCSNPNWKHDPKPMSWDLL